MKKFIISILSAIIVLLGGYTAVDKLGAGYEPDIVAVVGSKSSSNALTYVHFATTTPTSTTSGIFVAGKGSADLNLCTVASSTASVINWYYEYSLDGTNWFSQDSYSVGSGVVTHNGATTTHSWTAPGTVQTCKNVTIDNLNSNWLKFVFYRNSGAAGATNFNLYAEANLIDRP